MAFHINRPRMLKKLFPIPLLLIGIYLLALHPYITPRSYDSVDYLQGIYHFAKTGSYLNEEGYAYGWAPLTSFILSIPQRLGFSSFWFVKGGITLFAIVASALIYALFSLEHRSYRVLAVSLFVLTPKSLMISTQVLTEWPFLMWSAAFLVCFHLLTENKEKQLLYTCLASFCLVFAILTRYIGVLLVIPPLLQLWKSRKKGSLPYTALTFVGASTYLVWRLCLKIWEKDVAYRFIFSQKAQYFSFFNPLGVFENTSDYLFYAHRIFGEPSLLLTLFSMTVAALLLIGIYRLWQRGELHPSDTYIFGSLILLCFYKYKLDRYILPIAPFLLCYLIEGIKEILSYFRKKEFIWKTLVSCWITILSVQVSYLLLFGNRYDYNGIAYLASPTPETFYRGKTLALYQASQYLKTISGRKKIYVSIDPFIDRLYVQIFTRAKTSSSLNEDNTTLAIVEKPPKGRFPFRWERLKTFGPYHIYRKIE